MPPPTKRSRKESEINPTVDLESFACIGYGTCLALDLTEKKEIDKSSCCKADDIVIGAVENLLTETEEAVDGARACSNDERGRVRSFCIVMRSELLSFIDKDVIALAVCDAILNKSVTAVDAYWPANCPTCDREAAMSMILPSDCNVEILVCVT